MLQKSLTNGIIGKKHVFNTTDKDGFQETEVIYLGAVRSKSKTYKIVTCAFIWGVNRHTNGSIYIFDAFNNELGKYQLGDMFDLPNKTSGTKLIFDKSGHTGCNAKTQIDFKGTLPKELFIRCTSDGGDMYQFQPIGSYKGH